MSSAYSTEEKGQKCPLIGANFSSSSLKKQYASMSRTANGPFSYFLSIVVATSDLSSLFHSFAPVIANPLAPSDARVYFSILDPCSVLIPFTLHLQNE